MATIRAQAYGTPDPRKPRTSPSKLRYFPSGRLYEVDFEYRFFDRYNWDKGKSVTLAGITITDQFMGEFHRQGLAKEFNCFGSFKRRFTWKKGEAIARSQMHPSGGRGG
jgi:hypothetical protein